MLGSLRLAPTSLHSKFECVQYYLVPEVKWSMAHGANFKGLVNELCQRMVWGIPRYETVRTAGPDHRQIFTSVVIVNGRTYEGEPRLNKKDAEQSAALAALREVAPQLLPPEAEYCSSLPSASSRRDDDPRSALDDLCKRFERLLGIPRVVAGGEGPPFTAWAWVNDIVYHGEPRGNKKDAEQNVSRKAYNAIVQTFRHPLQPMAVVHQPLSLPTLAETIAAACHRLYDQLCKNILYAQSSTDVVAGIIVQDIASGTAQLVAMGSGSKCISSHNLSANGDKVQDCHAEVVARRAFMRYLYSQAGITLSQANTSILEKMESGRLRLKSTIRIHLYISTPPCGDATECTRTDHDIIHGQVEPTIDGHCQPYWSCISRNVGYTRFKVEAGENGSVLEDHPRVQSWHRLKNRPSLSSHPLEERLVTPSCSDKILKWNALGFQGALLSKIMEPVYISSVVIGDSELFHHGHIARGICCRLTCDPASQLEVSHPRLLVVSNAPSRETFTDNARPDVSLHWTIGMDDPEQLNVSTGCLASGQPALICKRKLLESFYFLCRAAKIDLAADTPYCVIKATAEEYQRKKEQLYSELEGRRFGRWVKKPPEVDNFSL